MKQLHNEAGIKLFIFIMLILILSVSFTIFMTKWLITEMGDLWAVQNSEYIRQQVRSFITKTAQNKARQYETKFKKIDGQLSLLSLQVKQLLEHPSVNADFKSFQELLPERTDTGAYQNSGPLEIISVWWNQENKSMPIGDLQQLNTLSLMDRIMTQTIKQKPDINAFLIVSASGFARCFSTIFIPDDLRCSRFYTQSEPLSNPGRQTTWTWNPDSPENLTAATPIYLGNNFWGVVAVQVLLKELLTDFFAEANNQSFLLDHKSNLIAMPSQLGSVVKLKNMKPFGKTNSKTVCFYSDGKPYYLAYHPIPSPNWFLAVVAPEVAASISIKETLAGLKSRVNIFTSRFASVTMVLVLGSMIIAILFFFRNNHNVNNKFDNEFDNENDEFEDFEEDTANDLDAYDTNETESEKLRPQIDISLKKQLENKYIAVVTENKNVTMADSYSKLTDALQKVNELEKEHSIELADTNAKLQKEIEIRNRAETEIRYLSARLITESEEARKNLAQDLHDEFGQTLTGLHIEINDLLKSTPLKMTEQRTQIDRFLRLIEQLGDKIRSISSELRPDLLDDLGLVPTVEWSVKEFRNKYPHIKIEFQTVSFMKQRFIPEIEVVLYRIFQESLNNIIKHADSKNVSVTLTYRHPLVIMVVMDDGIGFDPGNTGSGGIGLLGMRERAATVNGSISIHSKPNEGVTIRVQLPV